MTGAAALLDVRNIADWFRFIRRTWKYSAAPTIAAGVGAIGSVLVWNEVSHVSTQLEQKRFEYAVSQAEDSVKDRLSTYIAMLRAGAGMVSSSQGAIGREPFRRFTEQLQIPQHYPGIQGIGFSVRLHSRNLPEAQTELERVAAGDLALYPAMSRREFHAILLLEPLDRRNEAALGYDMFSEPVRRAAMERARDSGMPAMSGKVQLVQEIEEKKQAGFLIYMPVYAGWMTPPTLAERRERLFGFVYSPFRTDDLMQGIFGTTKQPRVHIDIYDGIPNTSNLLHSSPGLRSEEPRFAVSRPLAIAGRHWTIVYTSRPEFEATSSFGFSLLALFGGLLGTALIVIAMWAQSRARRRADVAVAASFARARELEILYETSGKLAAELDRDRLVEAITDAGRDLAGAEIGAFFYNVTNAEGDSYQLFSLSGAPREAFIGMGMPRNTAIFSPTFSGESPVMSDDITKDDRYGHNAPHNGFPAGHWPVRSYLAVPVISRSGDVLGGLFFGHSRVGAFTKDAERSIVALAGHAAIAIDNANLFQAKQDEIAARAAIEAQQRLLLDELNHRVKNTLATVQSIASQTLRSSISPESFKAAFEGRLLALSNAHNILSREHWRGVMLSDLAHQVLLPHGAGEEGQIQIEGDSVWLRPGAAVILGMILHELATNAERHGSLSSATGRVYLRWDLKGVGHSANFQLTWRETGGTEAKEPAKLGFGSRMIERGAKHDLRGTAKFSYEADGFSCEIVAPAAEVMEPT